MSVYQTIGLYLLSMAVLVVILWTVAIGEDDESKPYYHCPDCGIVRGFDEPWFESTGCRRCPHCKGDLVP